ncbi:hypothetical protein DFJ73DRAFT_812268, partial [Zopfochytrium polystomum]
FTTTSARKYTTPDIKPDGSISAISKSAKQQLAYSVEADYVPSLSSVSGLPLFSAERHMARSKVAEEASRNARASNNTEDVWKATTALQFGNLVMDNEDEVVVEARSLLQNWIDNCGAVADDASSSVFHAMAANQLSAAVFQDVRELVSDAVNSNDAIRAGLWDSRIFGTISNPGIGASKLERDLRRRDLEATRERDSARMQLQREIELRATKLELEKAYEQKRQLEAKKAEIATQRMKREIIDAESAKAAVAAKKADEERKRKIARGTERANALYDMKQLKLLKASRRKIKRDAAIKNWRTLNRLWTCWNRAKTFREGHRQAAEIARRLQREQELELRAMRHHKFSKLSRCFLSWLSYMRSEAEQRRVRAQHEKRKKKMEDFLDSLRIRQQEKQREEILRQEELLRCARALERDPGENVTCNVNIGHSKSPPQSSSQSDAASSLPMKPPKELKISTSAETRRHDKDTRPQPSSLDPGPNIEIKTETTLIAPVTPVRRSQKFAPKVARKVLPAQSSRDRRLVEGIERRRLDEEARIRQEEDERHRYLQEKLEQKRLEQEVRENQRLVVEGSLSTKQALEAKEKERLHLLHLRKKADSWYRYILLRRIGLHPWKVYLALCAEEARAAAELHLKMTVRSVYRIWMSKVQSRQCAIEAKAVEYSHNLQIRRFFKEWTQNFTRMSASVESASALDHKHCLERMLKKWKWKAKESIMNRMRLEREKELLADSFAARYIPRRFLRKWRQNVLDAKEDRWKEFRKQQLRERIKELLTDSRFESELRRI